MNTRQMTTNFIQRSNSWQQVVRGYQNPDLKRSLWQIASSFIPYIILWFLMVLSLQVSYWLPLVLAIPAAGFMVRIFIIFHDCGHGSFFKSQRLNDSLGILKGIITFTPYYNWRHNHAVHHATTGDLDRRGVGDLYTMTVKEYVTAPYWKRLSYRLTRNPLVMFTIGSLLVFLIANRFSIGAEGKRERESVLWTDLALLVIVILAGLAIGIKDYLLIKLPILAIGTSIGVWLFYVQHQFEGVYWARHDQWDFYLAGYKGSSFYRLPGVLQWFTGNIGFHHIHHLNPRIPNYFLQKWHEENSIFQEVKPLEILSSLKSLKFRLWDEDRNMLVGFGSLKSLYTNTSLYTH
jgi:omega-6 fatty acid desaturase (delta-12 desaturase)